MDIINTVVSKVSDGTKVAFQKSSEIVEQTKLSFSISSEELKAKKAYEEIGRIMYLRYNQGEKVTNDIFSLCEDVDDTESKIRMCNRRINDLKNNNYCRKCGAPIDKLTNRCTNCNSK